MNPENRKSQNPLLSSHRWSDKISTHQQLGGIETSVIDNGRGRGVRVAWINTGSGLRFKVVLDRAMDIADAFFNEHSLAWISHSGIQPPDNSAVAGTQWLNSFGGGLVTTCGLTHVGGPEEDEWGVRGLHDRISHVPAEVVSIVQPDPLVSGNMEMSLTGKMVQSTTFGPQIELQRTISARLGSPVFKIHDEVTNLGNRPVPHMLLYHCNFGWPLVDEGAEILWEGDLQVPNDQSRKIFNEDSSYKTCRNPIDDHSGSGEAVGFIDIQPDSAGICHCGVHNPSTGIGVDLKFSKEQLPWLTNWQHWGKNEYVMALEPCTHPPIGQAAAREDDSLFFIEPGQSRSYQVELSVNG